MTTINPPHQPLHFPPLPKATAPLWFGVLGAPAAWAVQLQVIYSLTHTACHHNSRAILQAITVILLLTSLVCGIVCHFYRRGEEQFGEQRDRVHFLASLGSLSGVFYALVILAQGITTIMLDPCAT
jgi:hypothetical protein